MAVLRDQQPAQRPAITLVHGDAKPGNFAFEGGEVSAVFDWEMATIGDPMADIGWAEVLWPCPGSFTSLPGAMSTDEFVARWEQLTGITARASPVVPGLPGAQDGRHPARRRPSLRLGHSDDLRFLEMTYAIHPLTQAALHELGIDEPLEPGPLLPREERIQEVKEALSS